VNVPSWQVSSNSETGKQHCRLISVLFYVRCEIWWLGLRCLSAIPYKMYFVNCCNVSHHFLEQWLWLAAVLIGLVAVMLTFPTPVLLLGGLPCDWIAGLVLVITMQIGGCLQHTMQSMAESEARLEMFAESNRCIQVMVLS